jgi:hypothetical protein
VRLGEIVDVYPVLRGGAPCGAFAEEAADGRGAACALFAEDEYIVAGAVDVDTEFDGARAARLADDLGNGW